MYYDHIPKHREVYRTADIVNFLIKKGACVNALSNKGVSPLHYAFLPPVYKDTTPFSASQSNDVIRELIVNGADLNLPNASKQTPLHLEVIHLTDEIVVDLLTPYKLDAKTNDGDTLLHLASCKSLLIVKHLLQLGADINVKNNTGDTPLIVAAKHAKHAIVAELCACMVKNT